MWFEARGDTIVAKLTFHFFWDPCKYDATTKVFLIVDLEESVSVDISDVFVQALLKLQFS